MNNKTFIIFIVAIVAFAGGYFVNQFTGGPQVKSESRVNLETDYDSLSYFFGLFIGFNNEQYIQDEMDGKLILSGFNTVINDSTAYDPETLYMLAMGLQQRIGERESNKAQDEGVKFLTENSVKAGVIVTESGLQYETLKEGDGPMPSDTSTVTVHYHGTLIDGTVFDSSVDRGEPLTIPLNGVIKGWTEGLQLMSVGSKYRFYIPSSLGYGDQSSPKIPANSVLIFEVELLAVE